MIRTQIQLPDELYRKAKQLAAEKEISLAGVIRRSLEYLFQVDPPGRAQQGWELAPPANTGLIEDPFIDPHWRNEVNMGAAGGRLLPKRSDSQ